MPKVLLTGGAGFIGTHIAAALIERGFDPLIVDNFSNANPSVAMALGEVVGGAVEIHDVDCRDTEELVRLVELQGGVSGIIHLAAFKAVGESVRNPLKYYDNNLASMVSVLRVAERFPESAFVLSSSCTVYGQPETPFVTEETPLGNPHNPYGYTKQACERILSDFVAASENARGIILRYFNPIGAHPSGKIGEWPLGVPDNLVPYLTQTAVGIRDHLTVFGSDYDTPDGTCIRDFIHVCDLADAHIAALELALNAEAQTCEVFNIGTGRGHSVKELIDTFKNETGVDIDVRYGHRRAGDVSAIYANVDKAEKILGWKAERSLGDALRDAWNWQQTLSSKP